MELLKPALLVSLCAAVLFFAVCELAEAQKSSEAEVVKGDSNSCELNSVALDGLINEQRVNTGRIFVIARLGRGELKRSLNTERLANARFYLTDSGKIQKESVVFAEGERVDGAGRLEFYLGSKLYLVSLAARGRNVCLFCCDDPVLPNKWKRKRQAR